MTNIKNSAMLVTLSISMFSPKKTDKKVTREVIRDNNASADAGKFVKALLPDEAIEPIRKIASEARDWHYTHSLPWTDTGQRILPTRHYLDYTGKMRDYRVKFSGEVSVFLAEYPQHVEHAKHRLNGMFRVEDYPDAAVIPGKFSFETHYSPVPDSADFRVDVADDEMDALRAQVDQRVTDAVNAAQNDLWQRLAEPIGAMVERLGNPDNKFKDSLVGNIKDIVELIPALNLTGDPKLEELRLQAKAQLTHYAPDYLRDSTTVRAQTAEKARQILANMASYMTPA